jgi:hypothetical protein
MKISEIIRRVETNKETTKGEILTWLKDISPERDLIKVDSMAVGDTFWLTLVGGKSRPWVTLRKSKGMITAACFTHTALEGGFPCEDRYWGDKCFLGPTMTTIEEDRVKDKIYFPYRNTRHLGVVRKEFIKRLGG